MHSTSLCAALLALASCMHVSAIDFHIQLAANEHLSDIAFITSYAPAYLHRIPDPSAPTNASVPKRMQTLARRDGSIVFSNVAPGPWLLEILAPYLVFNQYRVDIPEDEQALASPTEEGGQVPKGQPAVRLHLRGHSLTSTLASPVLPYPLVAAPSGKQMFYTEPESFNIKALLANPMILMGGVGLLLMFVVPKLQAQLDPEAQAEMRASQAAMQKKMAAFQSGDIGALFREDRPAPSKPGSSAVQAGQGGTARRR